MGRRPTGSGARSRPSARPFPSKRGSAATPERSARDLDVLRACLAGGPGGEEAFVQHFGPLVRWAVGRTTASCRRTMDTARQEELRQEVFLALFEADARRLRQFDPSRGRLASWIALIARQTVLRHLERRKPPAPGEGIPDPADPSPGPDEAAALSEERSRLRRALEGLPDREALCLALMVEQALPPDEVARALGVGRRTVYEIRDRALERLRTALKS